MYPLEKYTYVEVPAKMNLDGDLVAGPMVVAISTYAGQTVRGVARCHPNDIETYDVSFGRELAAARCALKIAEKRAKRAVRKLVEATEIADRAHNHADQMGEYFMRSINEVEECAEHLAALTGETESCDCENCDGTCDCNCHN